MIRLPIPYYPPLQTEFLGDADNWFTRTDNRNYRVDAERGSDYISTGSGNDTIWAGGNDSSYQGDGSNVWVEGGTSIDTGAGNDVVNLGASAQSAVRLVLPWHDGGGSFAVQTGEGQDRVNVYDIDFVHINASDTDRSQDTFYFSASFDGDAVLDGVDSFDHVALNGGDWELTSTDNDALRYENDHGGSVTITGITHGYDDPFVTF